MTLQDWLADAQGIVCVPQRSRICMAKARAISDMHNTVLVAQAANVLLHNQMRLGLSVQ